MWKKIASIFNLDKEPIGQETEALDELRLATAALLIHAGLVDGNASEIESEKLRTILQNHFDLSNIELNRLVTEAQADERKAVDLYRYTKVVTEHLDQGGRIGIIELIWEVILADGKIDDYEANLVWRVAELIGVSTRDRVKLKKKVMENQQD